LTTKEKSNWVYNDEGLYRLWLASNKPITKFVRDHGEMIETVAAKITSGEKQAHYLAYG
jgi:hypothetical protein